jgi:hypothetical protein
VEHLKLERDDNAATFKEKSQVSGLATNIVGVALTSDERVLAIGTRDGTIDLWNPKQARLLATLEKRTEAVDQIAFSPNGKVLAVGNIRSKVTLWDVATAKSNSSLQWPDARTKLVFSPDSKHVATAGRNVAGKRTHSFVKVWEVSTGQERASFSPGDEFIQGLAFSPDGKRLATAGEDGTVRLWDPETQEEEKGGNMRAGLLGLSSVTFSPDGKRLVTGSREGVIGLWDLSTKQEVTTLTDLNTAADVFFGDEDTLVAFSRGRFFRWRAATLAQTDAPPGRAARAGAYVKDWREQAEILEERGRWAEALKVLDRVIQEQPQNPELWNEKGSVLERSGRLDEAHQAFSKTLELASADTNLWSGVIIAALTNRSGVLRRQNRMVEAGADFALAYNVPLRDPRSSPTLIDLSLFYNVRLERDFEKKRSHEGGPPVTEAYNLAALPHGVSSFAGVDFDIRGIVLLSSSVLKNYQMTFPEQVTGIPIRQKCRRCHFLHAAGWPESVEKQIGSYIFHYTSGDQQEVPLIYGENVHNCVVTNNASLHALRATVAWTSTNSHGTALRLFHTAWENPHPSIAIETMDYISQVTKSAPLLIALTVEP